MITLDQELLRQYFLKCEKDINKDYDAKIKKALADKDYAKVLQLHAEKAGAFSMIVCILRGCLINSNDEDVPRLVKEYLRRKL